MLRRLTVAIAVTGVALLAAGCMSGGTSERGARKASISSPAGNTQIGTLRLLDFTPDRAVAAYSFHLKGTRLTSSTDFSTLNVVIHVGTSVQTYLLGRMYTGAVVHATFQLGTTAPYIATYDVTAVVRSIEDAGGEGQDRLEEVALDSEQITVATPQAGGTSFCWNVSRAC